MALLFATVAWGLLTPDGMIVRVYARDFFFLMDSLWRLRSGQVPGIDFPTAIGPAFYWPFALIGRFTGGEMLDVLRANLLAGAVALALAIPVLRPRFSPPLYFLAAALVLLTAATGRSVDSPARVYDFLAPYNRWGWTFSLIATVVVTTPRRSASSWGDRLDAAVLGVSLFLLFHLKISFLLPVLGLAAIAVLLGFASWRVVGGAVLWLLALTAAVELSFGSTAAYLADIRDAAAVNVESGRAIRFGRIALSLLQGAAFGVPIVLILLTRLNGDPLHGWVRRWWRETLLLMTVLVAAAMIHAQNHPRWEIAMSAVALLVASELARRDAAASRVGPSSASHQIHKAWPARTALVSGVAVLLGVVPLLVADGRSILLHARESRFAGVCVSPALAGTPMAAFLFPAATGGGCAGISHRPLTSESPGSDTAELTRLLRATALLRGRVRSGEIILALEFSNPYPFLFRSTPPRGAVAWWDYGRTYSDRLRPDPASLVGQSDWIIQTDYEVPPPPVTPGLANHLRDVLGLLPKNEPGYGRRMWAIYGPAVRSQFRLVAESGELRIWRRVAPKSAGR